MYRYIFFILLLLCSCTIDKLVVHKVADVLSAEGSTVFTGDDDPGLIGDALPFALKLYESLLESAPEHMPLLLATGKAFCLYAFAYVQQPAEMLPDEDLYEQTRMLKRAKKLFLRAREYLLRALELQSPGFRAGLEEKNYKSVLADMEKNQAPYLLWTATSWMGAFTTDPFDLELMVSIPRALSLLEKVLELDEGLEMGSVHEILISYYGALPASMGGSEEKARYHYEKALQFSRGLKAAPYLNLAASVCVNQQNVEEFRELLNIVLELDPDASPENRLVNYLAGEKAAWMMENIDNWFLVDAGGDFSDFGDQEEGSFDLAGEDEGGF